MVENPKEYCHVGHVSNPSMACGCTYLCRRTFDVVVVSYTKGRPL